MKRFFTLLLISTFLLLTSCANYKMHITGTQFQTPPDSLGEPEHTMFLLGDAGYAELDEVAPAVRFLGKKLQQASKNSSVIILGDNVYPAGMPPRNSEERPLAEHRIKMQLDILKDYKGQVYIIPGNHDWYQSPPRKGVERAEKFVEDYLDRGNVWLPDSGCSGPVVENVSENVVVLFLDSEWYLMNWNKERELNEGCDIKSRESFAYFVLEELKKNRRKNVVIALHHPPHTNGPHGGKFSARQHLFPLTDMSEKLYIPLPGIGTVFQFLRATAGPSEDTSHPRYREMRRMLESSARNFGSFIFVSGHEHTLQHFEVDGQSFIVSGAGSKTNPVGKGRGMQFGYGKETGFSILKFYPQGEVFLEMWVSNPDGADGKLVYSRQIKGKLATYQTETTTEFKEFEEGKDSVTIALNPNVKNGAVHRFFWGDHYRKAYMQPVKVSSLDLSTWRGGVRPVKRGGGSQTNSLRVEDSEGQQWVLRDMVKDESRTIPYPFNKTFAKDVFADQFTAANPYVALTVGKMADAIHVYHPNPELFYIPKQPTLGDFNDAYGGSLYLVEERADGDWSKTASFGFSKNLVSTLDLLEKKEKKHDHRVDGAFTVRSRIFDNLLGDWDRHDDNWRWAALKDKEKDITFYRPIPRDRDQPFSRYDGVIPSIIRYTVPFTKQLRVYGPEISNIKWTNYNAKYFDMTFLSEPDWAVWEKEARFIQEHLTDEVIDEALRNFPPEIFALDGAWIAERLKGRRANLLTIARDLYRLVSKDVDVVGTNDQDYFEVDRLDDERTRVRVFASNKEGEKKDLFYERIFLRSETKEIRLYGLDQEDRFVIRGKVNKGILIRCIGGLDDDYFTDESSVKGWSKKTKIYDTKDDDHFQIGKEAADKTSNDPVMNTYDRRSWDAEHNYGLGFPIVAGNPDDGLVIGAGAIFTRYGFKKSPYASRHKVGGKYAFETNGWDLKYSGEFLRALNRWDFLLDANLQGPLYTRNFFGLGNESKFFLDDEEVDDDFIRVRQQLYGLYPTFRRQFGSHFSISFGANAEAIEIEETPERFVNRDNPDVRQDVFNMQFFGGGEFQVNFFNADDLVNPSQGLIFNATAGWKANLEETSRSFTYFGTELGFTLGGKRLTFATKAGVRHVEGDFEFYQGATLGARNNLRGYRNERFTGNTAFFHQNDLRLRLFNVENYILPFTLGIYGGYDYGRVWLKNEESDTWHNSVGGGIWLSPLDLAMLTFSMFQSDDGWRFEFRGRFAF